MSDTGKVGIAVIGCGFWGQQHVRVLSSLENVAVRAVSDIDLNRAKSVAKEYGVPKASANNSELLEDPSIEAVSICTPTTTHWAIAEQAVSSGKHVFVEKPVCDTVEQARLLIVKAGNTGVTVMPGHIERFNPGVKRVKQLLDQGIVGEVVLLHARRVGRWPDRIGDVGVVKDSAIHDLDLARYLLGEPVSIYARVGSLSHRFEDFAEIMLAFPGVKTAFIESNWLTPRKIRRLTITGREAVVDLDFLSQGVILESSRGISSLEGKRVEPLMLELKHFAECVAGDADPLVTGTDGLRALEMAEATLKSSSTGRVVHL
ncbi:Gfo/Idh/MocA family oxidoreductase [Candidatus Bathyarchaeota archaeon]|nr:Gfo/Idh/MocA family oxidoreductase [Candidatus Bathyarchaeota archaeon]